MGNLILTLIGIAVFAIASVSGIGYVSLNSAEIVSTSNRINSSIARVSAGISEYYIYHDSYPSTLKDMFPDILRSTPKLSSFTHSGTSLEPIAFNEDSLISIDGKKNAVLCLGSNNSSMIEMQSLVRSAVSIGREKISFYTSCNSGTEINVDMDVAELGDEEESLSMVSEGDSFWMIYHVSENKN